MSVLLAAALLAAQAAAADPAEQACYKRETTQQGMTRCAGEAYQRADRDLNRNWKVLVGNAKDRALRAELVKGQRAWIAYRDSQCAVAAWGSRGGTSWSMLVVSCKADLTRARSRELVGLLSHGD